MRQGGVYLITGGLGGIGLGLAELLGQRFCAKLVLLGRSAVPPHDEWSAQVAAQGEWSARIARLLALEAAGAEVLVLSADVTDEERMREVVALTQQRFGSLHGVLHAAGLPGAGLVRLKTRQEAERVMAPKTAGTLVLARVLAGLDLDFLALFSSESASSGGVGQVDYVAANAFLDAFAEGATMAPMAPKTGFRTVAIDWCEWQWDGWTRALPFDPEILRRLGNRRQIYGLSFEEGLDALARAVASGLPRVIVSTQNLTTSRRQKHSLADLLDGLEQFRRGKAGHYSRPLLGTPYVAPRTELESGLVFLWQEFLGIEQIGIEDNFLEMGGHSLLALQVIAKAHATLGVDIPLHAFLETPTVSELAAVAAVSVASPVPPALPAPVELPPVGAVEELTDQQVEELLATLLAEEGERR